jgi:hypothetical protein
MLTHCCRYHTSALFACLNNGDLPRVDEAMLDSHYFYTRNGHGYTSCGFARKATANFLREIKEYPDFLRQNWHESLKTAGSNSSALGFVVEQLTISWISVHGISKVKDFRNKPREVLAFPGDRPELSENAGFSFYIPLKCNYPAVDCIMVKVDSKKSRAVVAGIQITISDYHTDAEEVFLKPWKWWERELGCKKVEFIFIWALEDVGTKPDCVVVKERLTGPRGAGTIERPMYERRHVSIADISPRIGEKLKAARLSRRI